MGTFRALDRLFAHAGEVFVETLRSFCTTTRGTAFETLAEAHTYGAFVRRNSAQDRVMASWAGTSDVRHAFTFPGSDRVFLCLAAMTRWARGIDDTDARCALRRSVLIHEFWHAVVAAAVGQDEARIAAQQQALPLEESLAVWLEHDAAHDHPAMRDLVQSYASAGPYPAWPYAGMGVVEREFTTGGRTAVRRLVRGLIERPLVAQRKFDDLVAGTS